MIDESTSTKEGSVSNLPEGKRAYSFAKEEKEKEAVGCRSDAQPGSEAAAPSAGSRHGEKHEPKIRWRNQCISHLQKLGHLCAPSAASPPQQRSRRELLVMNPIE